MLPQKRAVSMAFPQSGGASPRSQSPRKNADFPSNGHDDEYNVIFQLGDRVYGYSRQMWYKARIIGVHQAAHPRDPTIPIPCYQIHYEGWTTKYDEWVLANTLIAITAENTKRAQRENEECLAGLTKKATKLRSERSSPRASIATTSAAGMDPALDKVVNGPRHVSPDGFFQASTVGESEPQPGSSSAQVPDKTPPKKRRSRATSSVTPSSQSPGSAIYNGDTIPMKKKRAPRKRPIPPALPPQPPMASTYPSTNGHLKRESSVIPNFASTSFGSGGLDSLRTVKSPVASSMPPPCIYPFPPAAGAAIRRQADADFAGPSNQGVNSSLRHAAPTNGLAQQNHIPDLQPQPFLRSFYQFALRGVSLLSHPSLQQLGVHRQVTLNFSFPNWMELLSSIGAASRVLVRLCQNPNVSPAAECHPTNLRLTLNGQHSFTETSTPLGQFTPAIELEVALLKRDNTITVEWTDTTMAGGPAQDFLIFIERAERKSMLIVMNELRLREVPMKESVTRLYETVSAAKSAGQLEPYSFPLMCPLSKHRIVDPAQGKNCQHPDCFDAASYIRANAVARARWICPICLSQVLLEDMIIDEYVRVLLEFTTHDRVLAISQDDTRDLIIQEVADPTA